MQELKLWKAIQLSLINNNKVALLIVCESSNSAPGKKGFKMALDKNGVLSGTIGGGIMENNLITDSLDYLKTENVTIIKTLYHNSSNHNENSGLICGGKQTFIIKVLNESNIPLVDEIISRIENQTEAILKITKEIIQISENNNLIEKYSFNYLDENNFEYKEKLGVNDTLYIIGGGHVGLAVSKVFSNLNFYIVIIDHRKDVATLKENSFVNETIITYYDKVCDIIKEGDNSYVVIVSSQHIGDETALKSIIRKKVKYVGMMGSKKKIKTIFDNLIESGIDKKVLDKVHSPIGLEIGAETPDEIAISIAAEVIKVKYGMN